MKFGVREICDVVLKKKAPGQFGNLYLDKGMPVLYFDTLKTSSLEGAATTVYAQGGRGNARLMAWEGERTVTFTMEDALISPAGFMILSGAGLVEASSEKTIKVHTTEQTDKVAVVLAEAIAVGIPFISSSTAGIAAEQPNHCGILVPAEDEKALTKAMSDMLSNHHNFSKKEIKVQGEKYTYQNVGKQLSDLYQRLVISMN